jgi:hypothetical protein
MIIIAMWLYVGAVWAIFAYKTHIRLYGKRRSVAALIANFALWPIAMPMAAFAPSK